MSSHARQGQAAKAGPKLRGTPLKLRRALMQAQAERDMKLEEIERDSGANVPSRPKTQRLRGRSKDIGRRDGPSTGLDLPSRPRKSAGQHADVQGEQALNQQRLEIRLAPTSAAVEKVHQRQCDTRGPVTPPPRRSPSTESPSQDSESSSESESDDSSSDDSSSDVEHTPVKRKARPRVKLSVSQTRELLVEFVARENDYLAALANGAKCYRDMPFWIDIRKRLRLVHIADKWSDLSRTFGIIVGPRERQAMAGKKVPCRNDIERLIESCARIRIRRGILDGFVGENLLNANMVPGLIESGSLEKCELMLGEMQHLQRKKYNQDAGDGSDNTDEESGDSSDSSDSRSSGTTSGSSSSSSDDDSSEDSDDDGEGTNSASETANQTALSPPTSPIMTSPHRHHVDEDSSPVSTAAATYHADTDAADDGDDGDDSSAIEQAIALLQRRQARKRRRPESGEDLQPSRGAMMHHEGEPMRKRHRQGVDGLLGRLADLI
ncbi:hypothetical protein PgNI_05223 [Pyricularia grisea]|uniref:Uncharacterized protein n=1 Tax=Pyricularia grisea TaxID=148305 RepID=A0A6P8B8C8_PYRGI|nr:hypothetical protein PgNI_05223 [Pyricularia grisea]TLD11364.1 hypothetical protein PgNI_05223 [Pyricularia grisea]